MADISPLALYNGRQAPLDADDPLSPDSSMGEHELWSYDWSAQSNASYTNGQSGISHGPFNWTCGLAASATCAIVNGTGLVITNAAGGGESYFYSPRGANGLSGYFADNLRWDRGGFAYMIQYSTTMPGTNYNYVALNGDYPYHGTLATRIRNGDGAPNNSTGGVSSATWWNNVQRVHYGGTAIGEDVLCIHVLDAWNMNTYYGTYSSGWPSIYDMTPIARQRHGVQGSAVQRISHRPFTSIDILHLCGGISSVFTIKKSRLITVGA